jgi:hypothetical protein
MYAHAHVHPYDCTETALTQSMRVCIGTLCCQRALYWHMVRMAYAYALTT